MCFELKNTVYKYSKNLKTLINKLQLEKAFKGTSTDSLTSLYFYTSIAFSKNLYLTFVIKKYFKSMAWKFCDEVLKLCNYFSRVI